MKFRSPKGDYEIDSLHKVLTVRINKNKKKEFLFILVKRRSKVCYINTDVIW